MSGKELNATGNERGMRRNSAENARTNGEDPRTVESFIGQILSPAVVEEICARLVRRMRMMTVSPIVRL